MGFRGESATQAMDWCQSSPTQFTLSYALLIITCAPLMYGSIVYHFGIDSKTQRLKYCVRYEAYEVRGSEPLGADSGARVGSEAIVMNGVPDVQITRHVSGAMIT